ncbi:MAG: DMT family transporter [Akkermansiaceae bacterium]
MAGFRIHRSTLFSSVLVDHFKLQGVVILWGFTAVLGALIALPPGEIVVFRTGIAAGVIALMVRGGLKVPRLDAMHYFLTGLVIGAHWVTFFLAVKMANVSICMVGVATLSLWTAILEPLIVKKRKFRVVDCVFGCVVLIGVSMIFKSELRYSAGFLVAIFSALLAAVFSVINSFHVHKTGHYVITFYEMLGAMFCAVGFLPFLQMEFDLTPSPLDWVFLLLLGGLCTVVAFSHYVELLKRLSVFTINFANNLEPVYGILLAAWILRDFQNLGSGFYTGASVIVISVLAYPATRRFWVSSKEGHSLRRSL